MTAKILITRPDPEGQELAQWACDATGDPDAVVTSPIMQITPIPQKPDLQDIQSLIFTSKNGVRAFAEMCPRRDLPCDVVGSATAALARSFGFQTRRIAPTADALITALTSPPIQGPCLFIRGEHIAVDLTTALLQHGISTREAILYHQQANPLNACALELLMREQPVILPLYSHRSAELIYSERKLRIAAPLYVAAISRKITNHVRQSAKILVATRPDDMAMREAILHLWKIANGLKPRE